MRAVQVAEIGQAPKPVTAPVPAPGAGQVQIRIAACGLNFADLLMIDGTYQERPALPYTPGMELAGTVTALGAGVTSPGIGARVAVFAGHGGLADYGCFPAERCLPLPDAMGFVRPPPSRSPMAPATWPSPIARGCNRARCCWCSARQAASG